MTEYHEANDAENKAILQSLVNNTDDDETKKVISCYTIEATGTEIIKKLSLLNVPPLKKAAAYLGIPEKTTKTKKADIISVILDRLNALLRELCGICGEYYNEDLNDPPLITCIICKQGCHNICQKPIIELLGDLTAKQQKSRPFMCSSCIGEYNDEDSEVVIVKTSKSKNSPTKIKEVKPSNENHSDHEAVQQQDVDTIPSAPPGSPGIPSAPPRSPGTPSAPPKSPGNSEHPSTDSDITVPICPVYKWGRCPDYENCQYRHPPRCWSWLTHGKCSYRNKCRFHHPPLCNNSLWSKECFNPECKFFHLSRTLRYKMEDEQLMNSLTLQNYQNQPQQPTQIPPIPAMQTNYQAQFPQLPQPATQSSQPQFNHVPQQQSYHVTRPPQQHAARSPPAQTGNSPQQYQQQQPNTLSKSDVSFLAKTIKDAIKEELSKDIINLKLELEQLKTLNTNRPLAAPHPQFHPYMFSQVPGAR